MEELKFLFKGKIYDGNNWIYGELWKYVGTEYFIIKELEVEKWKK